MCSNDLTFKQKAILEFISEYQNDYGTAPTYREIAAHFGYKSPKAAVDHVRSIEKKGYLRIRSGRSRGIELIEENHRVISIPLVGNIPAGKPELEYEEWRGSVAIDETLLEKSNSHHLLALRVEGNSMEDRGIFGDDLVIVDKSRTPREGDVVAALIDGENTLKTLARKDGKYFLKAESVRHKDWSPMEEMVIQGVVRLVVRSLF